MPYIKNPNYNPIDPRSQRYILVAEQTNPEMSVAPKTPVAKPKTQTTATSTMLTSPLTQVKTSTPQSLVTPKPVQQSVPQLPIKPLVPTTQNIAPNQSVPPKPLQPTVPQTPTVEPQLPVQEPQTPTPPTTPEVPKTGNEAVDANLKTLAEQAGAAGMTLDQYLALAAKSNQPTKQESDAIRNNLGIPDLVDKAFAQPKNTTVQMYTDLYDMSGLSDTKDKIKALDASIAQKRDDLVKATGELYNNPWLSQATRSGRLGNLQRIAMADIDNVLNQKQQYLDLYDKGISEIEETIKRSVYDTGAEQDLTVDKLNYLLTEAERDEAFAQRAIEQRALRYIPDYMASKPQSASEGFTLSEGETRYDAQGNVIAGMPKDTTTEKALSGEAAKIVNNSISALDDIAYIRTQVETQLGSGRFLDAQYKAAEKNVIDVIGRLRSGGAITEDEAKSFEALLPQMWESDATRISKLDRLEKNLKGVAESIQPGITQNQSKQPQTLGDFYKTTDEGNRAKIDGMIKDNLSDEEIMQAFGFKSEAQTSLKGNKTVENIANAIGQYESGGNYKARGPIVTSGQYKGERAMGKYQIMPGNLPSWSKQALGRVVTEQEFLANPKLQDQIAQYQMKNIYDQYGNLEDVASVWFSGRPVARAGNAKDVIGTSVPTYIKNVRAIYNKNA